MSNIAKRIRALENKVVELEKQVQPVQNAITLTPQVSISANQTQTVDIEKIISQIESHLLKEIDNIQGVYT